LDPTYYHDPTPNWTLLLPGSNIFEPFSNQDPTAWAISKAAPKALGPASRPGPAALVSLFYSKSEAAIDQE